MMGIRKKLKITSQIVQIKLNETNNSWSRAAIRTAIFTSSPFNGASSFSQDCEGLSPCWRSPFW